MTPRAAKVLSRLLILLAFVMLGVSLVVGATTYSRADPHQIVVVPADLQARVEEEAAALRENPDADTDPALADAPLVMKDKQDDVAGGTRLAPEVGPVVTLIVLAVVGLWLGTGALIVSRQPRNLAGWVFLALGSVISLNFLCQTLVFARLRAGASWIPILPLWATLGEYTLAPFVLLPLLWLLFPDGRPPSPRWRWAVWGFLIAVGISELAYVLTPGPLNNFVDAGVLYMNPLGVNALSGIAPTVTGIGALAAIILTAATILGVRWRFKRAAGEERQQLRWLVFVTTLAGALFFLIAVVGTIAESLGYADGALRILGVDVFNALFGVLFLVIVLGVPAAYLVALYRYHLWDLDVVIKKAAVALVLAGMLCVIGLLAFAWLGQVVLWGENPWIRAAVGIGIGLLVVPLLRLSRRIANRFVYGKRATPYQVLSEFSARIGDTYADSDVLPRMAKVLADGTGGTSARVLLRVGGDLQIAAEFGEGTGSEHQVPVVQHGDELGALAVTMPPNDPMNPAKDRLIHDLAAQAGPVLRNVRLIEELRASRQRLVAAQDEERRKLERNIHDGVQQQLVALAVRLKLADTLVERDPAKAHESLAALQIDAGTTLEDLRDLARGIYPPLLADKGLFSALEAQARKAAVPTQVTASGIERFPREVESTVYFCTLEALNNTAKYANATRTLVRLSQADGHLTFTVDDDGTGFDSEAISSGTGLQGMADRLDAIGGTFEITSSPGGGTTVTGRVPVTASTQTDAAAQADSSRSGPNADFGM